MMKKENKQQKVYRIVKARIIEHVYAPGQRIVIDQLAKELETSSIPVREAIRQLEAERLIVYQRNVGAVVAEVNEADYSDTLRVLAVIEGYATALSAQNLTTKKITKLRHLNDLMEEALDDFEMLTYGELNAQFHRLISDASRNKFLIESIRDTWERLDSIRGTGANLYSRRVLESIKEHEAMISLIESKADPLEIEKVARNHKLATAEDFERRRLKRLENEQQNWNG